MSIGAEPRRFEAPALGAGDLRVEVERLFARPHRSELVAFFGRGEAGEIEIDGQLVTVVPTSCELELRSALAAVEGDERARRVFLVDWADGSLPLDIACRLAGGRLYRIARDTRLAQLFGAMRVDPTVLGSALARVVLAAPDAGERLRRVPFRGQVLQAREAYRRFLAAWFDLSADTEAELLVWAVRSGGGPELVQRGECDAAWRGLREELARSVAEQWGPLGSAVWQAWEAGAGLALVEVALLVDALAGRIGQADYVVGLLRGHLTRSASGWGESLMAASGRVGPVLGEALRALSGDERRRASGGAERAIADPLMREALAASVFLPVGHAARSVALAQTIEACVDRAGGGAVAAMRDALAEVEAHRLDGELTSEATREARRMVARLGAYLAAPGFAVRTAPGASYQEALDLAREYAETGGYVDWARHVARGLTEGGLGAAAQRVTAAVDGLRQEADRRFAHGLVGWLESGQPAAEVLPVAHVARRVVAPFLHGHEHRKLLVLMMDGMSAAALVQLLRSLQREPDRWAPAAWAPADYRGRPAGTLPPVLATLPTLTQASRTAFFAGEVEGASGDEARLWAANPALRGLASEGKVLPLLTANQVMGTSGAHATAIEAIHGDDRVVALIVNAIDDQLSASTQVAWNPTVDGIRPLREIMAAAGYAERAVLLVSDHGHAFGDLMRTREVSGDGARWRVLAGRAQAEDGEIELPRRGTWRPTGAARVAVLWDERLVNRPKKFGEHGGASLAEVVCPAALVVPETLSSPLLPQNAEVRAVPRLEPRWWRLEGTDERGARAPAVAVEAGAESARQLTLEVVAPVIAPPRAAAVRAGATRAGEVPRAPLVAALERSPVFRAHTNDQPRERVEEALRGLTVLVEAGDRLAEGEFARQCGVVAFRIGGFVARIGEIVNLEGYGVLRHDQAGRQVVLEREQLMQLFEVGL